MKRIKLDRADQAVKQFLRSLPVEAGGVEIELEGQVICKVVASRQFTDAEKKALAEERWRLIRRAQERNKGVPARVLAKEASEAVEQVRRNRQ
jgi:hypothetical protein